MKRHLFLPFFLFCLIGTLHAQIPDGSIAPDFTATDIDGVERNLYDVLAEGKSVIIDFSATWCGPCWSYHNTGALHDYMEQYGPEGTDESMVLYVECDIETTLDDLHGTGGNTTGDWVTGTNYPIIDAAFIGSMYQISAYPTIMMVCPDRRILNLGQISSDEIRTNTLDCSTIDISPEIGFWADNPNGCNSLNVQFNDVSWPRPDTYLWDFGDGNTSTERNPMHTYTEVGEYSVTLQGTNANGENSIIKEEFVTVGYGNPHPTENVGPENFDIGSGRYFEGGHQALIFDAIDDFVLASVKVFSDKEEERTVVLLDAEGNLVNMKTTMIPVGEHRIDLDMFVPQGTDYRLGLYSNAFLYRNDGGVQYPYTINGLVNIKESTAGTAPLQYYYYFYDWEVREPGCDNLSNDDEIIEDATQLYPIPVDGYLTIEMENVPKGQPRVFNNIGQIVKIPTHQQNNGWRLDFNSINTGVYFVEINNRIYTVPKI